MKKPSHTSPPKWVDRILERICDPHLLEGILGDLHEKHAQYQRESQGKLYQLKYLWVVLGFLKPFTWKKKISLRLFSFPMWQNYLKVALRQLAKNKGLSAINIFGLTIGVAGCLTIGLYVIDEFSYDRNHPNGDYSYRVYNQRITNEAQGLVALTPPQFSPNLKENFPEVKHTLRIINVYAKLLFEAGDKQILEEKGIYAEPQLFDFFAIPLLEGVPEEALSGPDGILLSQSMAQKYFGQESALGKSIQINGNPVQVSGVFQDVSPHFHLEFDYIFSFERLKNQVAAERMESWVWQQFYTYVQLTPKGNIKSLAEKFLTHVETHAYPHTQPNGFSYIPRFQQLKDIHLHSQAFQWDIAVRGNIQTVYALMAMGLFLLIIACVNFVNLSTAYADHRTKEVGIRKTAGARRSQVRFQFLGEATLVALISVILASILTFLWLPHVNAYLQKELYFNPLTQPIWSISLLGISIGIGFLAGSYPALIISRFSPSKAIKGLRVGGASHKQYLRKALVTLQFGLSIFLVLATLIIHNQVNFLSQKDLGFNKDHVLTFPLRGDMESRLEEVKSEFKRIPHVHNATVGYGFPGDIVAGDLIFKPGQEEAYPINMFTIDHDYIPTMELELLAGRNFSKQIPTDVSEAFIINETAVRELGYASPASALNQPLHWKIWDQQNDSLKRGRVIGVIKDFHYKSLREKIGSSVLHIYPRAYWKVALKISGNSLPQTLSSIENTWNGMETGYPFDYQFLDESFDTMYKEEERMSMVLKIFTVFTIFVACIGLLSLTSFSAQQRTKEIGIRKVMGASRGQILELITREFIILVGISFLLASPLAWLILGKWLENFPYHVSLKVITFLLAGMGSLLIAFGTIFYQSLKAASADPIRSLRYE
ncbi:MAG: FtsX-like permease family protein [Bacteroidota bacterium]